MSAPQESGRKYLHKAKYSTSRSPVRHQHQRSSRNTSPVRYRRRSHSRSPHRRWRSRSRSPRSRSRSPRRPHSRPKSRSKSPEYHQQKQSSFDRSCPPQQWVAVEVFKNKCSLRTAYLCACQCIWPSHTSKKSQEVNLQCPLTLVLQCNHFGEVRL